MSLESITRREFFKQSAYLLGGSFISGYSDFSNESKVPKRFKSNINNVHWISYAPTNFNPEIRKFPDEESLREDLIKLHKFGFNGVITYGSDGTLYHVPRIAKEEGFKAAIMGIWNPSSREEKKNAWQQRKYADAYIIGNEGLSSGLYTLPKLEKVIKQAKEATGKPVTTTQQIEYYYDWGETLMNLGDWLCPNVHPYWHNITNPELAAEWTVREYLYLKQRRNLLGLNKKPILFREVGLPSAGCGDCNELNQRKYYRKLMENDVKVNFSVFEAFDQYWKGWRPVEPHWGIFTKDREPKLAAHFFKRIFTNPELSTVNMGDINLEL